MSLPQPLIYDQIIGEDLSPSLRMIRDSLSAGTRVLDVGCASGYFAEHLQTRGCSVVGVEFDQAAVDVARMRGLEAHQVDLEREPLPSEGFDAVVFADVLEHIRTADEVLASVRAERVLISLPNSGHWSFRYEILRGRFPRADSGLFDRTHVRWFTLASAREMIEQAGFRITSERYNPLLPFERRGIPGVVAAREPLTRRYPSLLAYQFVFDARRR